MGVNYTIKHLQRLAKNDKTIRQILGITLITTIINSFLIIGIIIAMGVYAYNNQDAPNMVTVPIEIFEVDDPPVPTEQLRFDK